jgi:hypothetical protein
MKLAPSSITKVRVYVYLEGQDIDNYDFASIGRKISVNFGFTKNRFEGTDINYDGPDYNILTDTIPPVITLVGSELVTVSLGNPYTDQGATAQDNIEGDITGNIVINNPVNTEVLGTYIITYNVKDFAGNPAEEVTRTVIVE